MAEFLEREVETPEDFDLYCHYVAGLVGIGLSRLFSISGVEDKSMAAEEQLSNSMGLFLQKTNIIRDYHEDILSDRIFWPSDVWSEYSDNLEDFINSSANTSLGCLNHLITEALSHTQDCLAYLRLIKDPDVFRFCAIPQVMAIATMAEIYNNPDVFRKNVKIRKGLTARLIMQTNSFEDVQKVFEEFALDILRKIPKEDPNGFLAATYLRRLVSNPAKIRRFEVISKEITLNEKHAIAS